MSSLDDVVAQRVRGAGTLVRYADGELIHSRGDSKPGLSIVETGSVLVGVYGADGSFVMTSILGPGHTFGEFTLFAGLPRTHDITASGPTEIHQLSGNRFLHICEQTPEIYRALLSASLARTHVLLELMDAMRRLPMLERTAKVLLTMMTLTGDDNVFRCRQSDLAYTLGVSRMSLSKALKQLSERGLINLGYGEIRLPNKAALVEWVAQNAHTIE